MAKIFRTEVLAVGADKIRLTASEDGKFAFKAVNNDGTTGDDVFSLDSIGSDVSSLNTKVVSETNNRGSDVASLNTKVGAETTARTNALNSEGSDRAAAKTALDSAITSEENSRGSDVASLNTKIGDETTARTNALNSEGSDRAAAKTALDSAITSEENSRGSDVASLNTKVTAEGNTRGSDVASLNNLLNLENVFATGVALTQNAESVTVSFPNGTFATAPSCVATVRGTDADDPMVGVMLSGTASTSEVKFGFTDPIPTSTMKLDILASV